MDIIKTLLLVIVVIAAATVGLIKETFSQTIKKRLKQKNMTKHWPSLLSVILRQQIISRTQ